MSPSTATDALSQLALLTDSATEPILSPSDLTALLAAAQAATVWTANTAYAYGQRVIPTSANFRGAWFRVSVPGLSGVTEPSWNNIGSSCDQFMGFYTGASLLGLSVISDGTVTWRNDGRAPSDVFAVRSAARQAWLLKAARAAALVDTTLGSDRFAWSQVHSHCLTMAARFVSPSLI